MFGAAGNGQGDETAVIQSAIDKAIAYNGLGTVVVPAGKTYRFVGPLNIGSGHDVKFTGGGKLLTASSTVNGFRFGANGNDGTYAEQPISPASAGAMSVTTTNAPTVVAGDYVIIYTGNIVTSAGPPTQPIGNPDAELNRVVSVAGHVVTLERPLTKNYAVEKYNVGEDMTTGITAVGNAGTAAPLALRKIDPAVNVTFDGILVEHHGSGSFLAGHQVWNLTVANVTADSDWHFMSISGWTGEMRDSAIHLVNAGDASNNPQWFTTAYGARDVALRRCTFTADHMGLCHIHEGSANVEVEDTTMTNAPGWTTNNSPVISVRARGYNIDLDNVTVTNASEAAGGACLRVDPNVSGEADGCTFTGGAAQVINDSGSFVVH